jgi:hypothetical protein
VSEQNPDVSPREIRALGPSGDAEALRRAYLELLKLSLCDLTGAGTRTVSWSGDRRVFSRDLTGADQLQWRAAGRDWPLNALTMTGLLRLDDLQSCVETVIADEVPGDLIEAGAWRGGSSILMRATLNSLGARDRTVWVADSFSGFPVPEADGDQADIELEAEMEGLDYLAPNLEQVQGHFDRFACLDGVRFVPGFFEETMAGLGAERWSVIRLDGDTYKATRLTLEALYPNLEVGGFVILDDYHFLDGCRRATDDFRRAHGISEPIERVDYNAGRWRREDPTPISVPTADPAGAKTAAAAAPVSGRRAFAGSPVTMPTDRELQLQDELTALRAQLTAAEQELGALRNTPWARARRWTLDRARQG